MKKTLEYKIFNIISILLVTVFALICLLPLLITISGSLTSDKDLFGGISLIPKNPTLDSYRQIFRNGLDIGRAYINTIGLTVIGTVISVLLTSMTSYVLYRRDFKARGFFSFYFYFTTLFSGGLIPSYLLNTALGLKDTYLILLFSGLLANTQIIIVRSFMTSNVPQSLIEAAKIDGAGDFQIYYKIVLPAIGSILATIALLTSLGYWNNWYTASIYIKDTDKFPLMYYLQKIFNDAAMREKMLLEGAIEADNYQSVGESFKMAMTVATMGPVVLFYPFFQRYFVSGITIGAVKE